MKPTKLSPLYIVQRLQVTSYLGGIEYYDLLADTGKEWRTNPKDAYAFDQLTQAARIAAAEGAHIRVLVSDTDAKEFGIA